MKALIALAAVALAAAGCAQTRSASIGQCLDRTGLAVTCDSVAAVTGLEGEPLHQTPARAPGDPAARAEVARQ